MHKSRQEPLLLRDRRRWKAQAAADVFKRRRPGSSRLSIALRYSCIEKQCRTTTNSSSSNTPHLKMMVPPVAKKRHQ